MQAQTPRQLPHPLGRVQVRAVGWEEVEFEMARLTEPPSLVQARVVIVCVVRDHNNPPSRPAGCLLQLLHKAEERLFVEPVVFPAKDEAAILRRTAPVCEAIPIYGPGPLDLLRRGDGFDPACEPCTPAYTLASSAPKYKIHAE
jgi:hypothetical protein